MANKKISELTLLDTVSANLQLTVLPVLDTASGTTRKVTLQQLNDSIEANIPFAAAAFTQANTANVNALSSGSYANAAFSRANNTLNVSTGGTITGDVTINGNISISGCTATLSLSSMRISDHIIDVGFGTSGVPSQNAGIRVLRGDENPVQLRWNESSNKWQFTNDGTEYIEFSDVTSSQLSSAYNQANTANTNAISSGSYANAAFIKANNSLNVSIGGSITGNIVVNGNVTANYFSGDGSLLTGISATANTGNVSFNDVTIQGVTSYSGLNISASPEDTANLKYLRIRSGDADSHIHFDSGNNSQYDIIFGDDSKYLMVSNTGNVVVGTYENYANTWIFGVDGRTKIPHGVNNPSTARGVAGDKAGMILFSGAYLYYCYADYTDGQSPIWQKVAMDNTDWD